MVISTVSNTFQTLFCSDDDGAALKAHALEGKLPNTGVRGIAWGVFLEALPKSPSAMVEAASAVRTQYDQYVQTYIVDPRSKTEELDPSINNPLSQDEESPWAVFFQNEELQKIINQDIERCYPDIPFFQEQQVKDMMLRILFVYAKENPALSYRQGMHELLAPILYLLDHERKSVQLNSEADETENDKVLKSLSDIKYVEHDAFSLFINLMRTTAQWFSPGNIGNNAQKRSRKGSMVEEESTEETHSPVVTKCRRIQHLVLKSKDPELYSHLESLKVEAQLYLLRWVRLLLGREFHIDDTLLLWDAIFAHSSDLCLVDYICVAMLIFIRAQLLSRDYSGCMTRLFKYPPVEDVRLFIEQARNLAANKPLQTQTQQASMISQARHVTFSDFETKTPTKPQKAPEQQLTAVTLAPTFKHMLYVDMNTRDIPELQSQLRNLRDTQLAVAQSLEGIVQTVQKTLIENPTLSNIDSLAIALAEMKQAKDILSGFLPVTLVLPPVENKSKIEEEEEDVLVGSGIVAQEPIIDPLGAVSFYTSNVGRYA